MQPSNLEPDGFAPATNLVAIADAGGIARAVATLNLTQPVASRQIFALEAELGVSLFERIGRRVKLTSDGENLLQRSRQLLQQAESLAERAQTVCPQFRRPTA
jgi:DNA-binding transcriptional LysR family regulator